MEKKMQSVMRRWATNFSVTALWIALSLGSCVAWTQQPLTFAPYHANATYAVGEKVGWTVTPISPAEQKQNTYTYTIKKNNMDVIKQGTLDLSTGSAIIEVTSNEPVMLYAEVFSNSAKEHIVALGAAVDPDKLKPSANSPADFDRFWLSKLAKLADVPINPVVTNVAYENSAIELFTIKLDSLDSHVQGYLAKPNKQGKFPALVLFQYAGVYKLDPNSSAKRAQQGWLVFNVDSHDIAPTESTGVSTDYFKIGNTDKEKSYFLNMYLRDTRAIDYLVTRPDWDGKTIVLMGSSMGGQQSLATAGLNPNRITAVLVNEPAGADSNGDLHGRKAGYPYWPSNDARAMQAGLYFDTVNFASHIKAATLLAMGYIDTTAPPAGEWTLYNRLEAPKEVIPMIEAAHSNKTPKMLGAYSKRSEEWLAEILKDGKPSIK